MDDELAGESWAAILARRSPEGRELAERYWKADRDCAALGRRCADALAAGEDISDIMAEWEVARVEAERLQKAVYVAARQ